MLTVKERMVLVELMKGKPNKSIAHDLGIGLGTVKIHLKHIFIKMGVSNRVQAVLKGQECGYS